ncbi:MAG: hypothetical protein KDK28_06525 [Maritimibacter sp.]|nr:hypothetical protein [Maritimibacter sp.]
MSATVIAFAGRTAKRTSDRTVAALSAIATTGAAEHANNIVPLSAWRGRARARRTPNGVFFTTGVLATLGAHA